MRIVFFSLYAALLAGSAAAQDPEDFRVEATFSLWLRNATGTIRSGISPVDLESDLGIRQNRPQFAGSLVFKPGRHHRLIVEGAPYRLSGEQDAVRDFTFAGRTYRFREHLTSTADITHVAGAYQYDLVSRPSGHFGLQAGVAYVDASGTVTGRTSGFAGTEQQSFALPLAGGEFRAFLVPGRQWLSAGGELKGMSLGDYGHWLQGGAAIGVGLGRHLTLQAGYRVVDAEVQRRDGTRGFAPRFTGPLFSVQLRN